MIHLGDITKISGYDAPAVDVVVGGSPCQDLSIAGKHAGLAGERSGLYMEQIRIIKEMRDADAVLRGRADVDIRPRYMVWENVPGAFSSNGGKDFASVVEEAIRVSEPEAPDVPVPEKGWPTSGILFDECSRWSVAWRVLDAQFWGVPQRRRRIALVADFGGRSAGEILFERECLRGYFAESRTPRQGIAGESKDRVGADDCKGIDIYNSAVTYDKAATLTASTWRGASNTGPSVMVPYTPKIRCGKEGGGKGALVQTDMSATLATNNDQYLFQPIICVATQQGGAEIRIDDKAPTITAAAGMSGNNQPVVCYDARGNGNGLTCNTLIGDHNNRITDYTSIMVEPQPVYADTAGCNGKGGKEDTSYTLNTIDRPAVVCCTDASLYTVCK